MGIRAIVLLSILFCCCCSHKKIYSTDTIYQLPTEEYLVWVYSCAENCLLIDVRTEREYRKSHLPNAINIDYLSGHFYEEVKKLDTSKTVFLYCQTAHRSPLAVKKLKKAGFRNIYDLRGGYATTKKYEKLIEHKIIEEPR